MREFQFEILPDGSIGARYYFDVRGDVPAQAVKAGATLHMERITKDTLPAREAEILEAHVRPEAYRMKEGKLENQEKNTRRE